MSKKINVIETSKHVILLLIGCVLILPFYFTIVHSLQPEGFIPITQKLYFWPEKLSFQNYVDAWKYSNLGKGYLNSLFYVSVYTAISGILAMLVGYVLAKKKFRGNKVLFILFLSTLMVPGEVLLIPNFLLITDLKLFDTFGALIIPGLVNVMGVFIAKQYMDSIPDSILEAADIDGAGEVRKFFSVVMPMYISAFATYVIITFTATWNEYLWPLIVLQDSGKYPVQLKVNAFTAANLGSDIHLEVLKSAALIETVIPVIIVFIIFQRKFVDGLVLSGLK